MIQRAAIGRPLLCDKKLWVRFVAHGSLPLMREVARQRRDGGREHEGLQQGEYSSGEGAEEEYDAVGTKAVV